MVKSNTTIGGCGKHPGQSMINCPICADEQYNSTPFTKPENVTFYGQRLKILRVLKGFSCQQLSNETGLSKQSLSKFELGHLRPSKLTVLGLAAYFDVPAAFFTIHSISIDFIGNKHIIKTR